MNTDSPRNLWLHEQESPNAAISLGTYRLGVAGAFAGEPEGDGLVNCKFEQRFDHQPHLSVALPGSPLAMAAALALSPRQEGHLFLPSRNQQYPIWLDEVHHDTTTTCRCTASHTPIPVLVESSEIHRGIFHLFNWPVIQIASDSRRDIGTTPSHFRFDDEQWCVEVHAHPKHKESLASLSKTAGYAMTHAGEIRRLDEGLFDAAALSRLCDTLHTFFGFVMGRWAGPQLTHGHDQNGRLCYQDAGIGWLTPGRRNSSTSWFDPQHGEVLGELFPGFTRVYSDATWSMPLRKAIDWYVSANQIGNGGVRVDNALLFTQAALEVLAWTYCVIDRRMVSKKAFGPGGLSATDKISLLLTSLGIPKEIPESLSALIDQQQLIRKPSTLPDALTGIRNGLVHPDGSQTVVDGAYYAAWRASQWLVELCILFVCGYQGPYMSRVGDGGSPIWDRVPWASGTVRTHERHN